jgi:hypothetical protein
MNQIVKATVLTNKLTCTIDKEARTISFIFCYCQYKIYLKEKIDMDDEELMVEYTNLLTLRIVYQFAFDKNYKLKRKKSPMS